jgi:hypothetical protein
MPLGMGQQFMTFPWRIDALLNSDLSLAICHLKLVISEMANNK